MNDRCAKCGSMKIIPRVPMQDQGQYSDGQLKAHVGFLRPEAMLFKGRTYAKMSANICGECGYVELFAADPKLLYEAYLKTRTGHGGAT
ncbi:MAG: hypothetical protein IT581_10750 [Verrucomicrobiales bacterium]|nr:hypothetical protein [Verrucomicrobiales bacterium]